MKIIDCAFDSVKKSRRFFSFPPFEKREYSVVRLGKVSAMRVVPGIIPKPPYITGPPSVTSPDIVIKSRYEIRRMHDVCRLARKILNQASAHIRPEITTDQLDEIVHNLAIKNQAYPSPLLYKGFPKSCCTSVNNVALHGIPDDRKLEDGDIINLDITIYKDGFHGDLSETYKVGTVDKNAEDLINQTKTALNHAIEICAPGVKFSKIGAEIEKSLSNLTVIPQICGHGIGRVFHELPDIIHVNHASDVVMLPGMVFTIEPCVSEGVCGIRLLEDGWTYISADDSRSAQFEHTVAITDNGHLVLTADEV